jgi:WD40 repeat protein
VQFSRDGVWLASAGNDPSVRLWSVSERLGQQGSKPDRFDEAGQTLLGTDTTAYDVTFSPDGAFIAAGSRDGVVRLWNSHSGEQVREYAGHTGRVYGVAFSPDGHALASCSKDGTILITDLSSQKQRALLGHVGSVNTVRFSRGGARLASAGTDGTIRLWDTSTWVEIGATSPLVVDEELGAVEARTGLCLVQGEAVYSHGQCSPPPSP